MIVLLTLAAFVVTTAVVGAAWLGYTAGYAAGRTDEAASHRRATPARHVRPLANAS